MIKEDKYIDENSNIHYAISELSSGGQGIVYRTRDTELALKIEIDANTRMPISADENKSTKLNRLRLLPIPSDINITIPLATLKDKSGYIMRLLNDMQPFEKAFKSNNEPIYTNDWLKELATEYKEIADIFANYISTGGATRRLNAYFKVACYLSKLHSSGLVYCDISENNMFISSNVDTNNVWLIDADNVNFQKSTLKNGYYTNGYGAPEVIQGKGCSFYSDSYALLVAMFWQVSGTHPFKGSMLESDDWSDDFSDDKEQRAYNGEFPWILDKTDTSNERDTAIPSECVFSTKMLTLLDTMFCHEGKIDIYYRPSMYQIAEQIADELNEMIKCTSCEMEYNFFEHEMCPYCDKKADNVIVITTYYYHNDTKGNVIKRFVENANDVINIPLRLITNNPIIDIDKVAFEIIFDGKCLIKKVHEFKNITILETNEELFGKYETNKKEFALIVKDDNSTTFIEFKVIR